MIPKIIHRIWLGSPLPDKYNYDFQSLMPDWREILWTDEMLREELHTMLDHYINAINTSNKANAARVELLCKHGGVYLDCDVVPVRSFDPITSREFFAAYESAIDRRLIGFAVFGCEPHCQIMKDILYGYSKRFVARPYRPELQVHSSGPGLFTSIIKYHPGYESKYLLPCRMLYPRSPLDKYTRTDLFDKTKPDCPYTLHLWEGSWKKEYGK